MRTLVIHPNDESTYSLRVLYEGVDDVLVVDENASNSHIIHLLNSGEFETVMLLGHGTEYGLLAPMGQEQFGRYIISSDHVQFLRNIPNLICIWCNANIFGYKYNLTGLFSSMIISEISEASECGVPVDGMTTEDMRENTHQWAAAVHECISQAEHLSDVPELIENCVSERELSPLDDFNYHGLEYLLLGNCKE